MPIVIDASALVEVVARSERAAAVEAAFEGVELVAPDLVNAEVLAVLRRWLVTGAVSDRQAEQAVRNLIAAPVRRFSTAPLVASVWSLRENVTAYDACYVALARRLGCPLLTLDARLARAPTLGVDIVVPA